jgi:hypothetical protein
MAIKAAQHGTYTTLKFTGYSEGVGEAGIHIRLLKAIDRNQSLGSVDTRDWVEVFVLLVMISTGIR